MFDARPQLTLKQRSGCGFRTAVAAIVVSAAPGIGVAEIIWSGDFSGGDFTQWHTPSDDTVVTFHEIPAYGRPIQYGEQAQAHVGNGDLLSLVASTNRTVDGVFYPKGPTRGSSDYAAKFTVKTSDNGSEPADCDNGVCSRRRTELTVQRMLPKFHDALPYLSERWLSISVFVPSDWDDSGNSWGPLAFQIKALNDGGGIGPAITLNLEDGAWMVEHNWTDVPNCQCRLPWQQAMNYMASGTQAALIPDFPNQAASEAAMTLTKGIWTDWVMHVKFDARGAGDGGKGFLDVWNRKDTGNWVHVLNLEPRKVTIGGMTFDRGIGQNAPATATSPGGFGIKAGLYMDSGQVLGLDDSRVLYNANIKVGNPQTIFAEMSPDGSSPGSAIAQEVSPPNPPTVNR